MTDDDIIDPKAVHAHDPMYGGHEPKWETRGHRNEEPYAYNFRQCSYCGSVHPVDAVAMLKAGARIEMASHKNYKAYIHGVPNPIAGQDCVIGSRSGELIDGKRETIPMRGAAPAEIMVKLYTNHVRDQKQWAEMLAARG